MRTRPFEKWRGEKLKIFKLLNVEKEAGIQLTESYAMYPAAAVSGYYFAHPESRYFMVNRVQEDQIKDYSRRKGLSTGELKKLLNQNT